MTCPQPHSSSETEGKQETAIQITFSSEPDWMAAGLKTLLRFYCRPWPVLHIFNYTFS